MSGTDRPSSAPSERRASARTAVVWEALRPVLDAGFAAVLDSGLAAQPASGPPGSETGGLGGAGALDVLDIGGGTGGFSVRVAQRGHRVTVVDPSPDALAALSRRAREVGVAVTGQQGDLSSLLGDSGVGPDSADVVLCHGVLEVVDDPVRALSTIRAVLRPGGTLSLLVAQLHAGVVARAMAGHFTQALALLDPANAGAAAPAGRTGRRFTHDELTALLAEAGFELDSVRAVRVFADLVPSSLLDLEPGATAALVELERAVSERPEYLPLATQLHLLAR